MITRLLKLLRRLRLRWTPQAGGTVMARQQRLILLILPYGDKYTWIAYYIIAVMPAFYAQADCLFPTQRAAKRAASKWLMSQGESP